MTRWARLTWQSADPARLAADLEIRLGSRSVPHASVPRARVIGLGSTELELVPWRREAPRDEPQAAGRLVLEPITDLVPDAELTNVPSLELVGIAWATVELDRAADELREWLDPGGSTGPDSDGEDPHLGARTRPRRSNGLPGEVMVLAEPTTEGRLAASLARDGEGPCALYLWPPGGLDGWVHDAHARGVTVTGRRAGPFGASVLVPDRRPEITVAVAGPHVIVVADRSPSSRAIPGGTIAA